MSDHKSTTQGEQSAIDASYLEHNALDCPSRPLFHGPNLTVAHPPHDDSRGLQNFWMYQMDSVAALTPEELRKYCLPLARIKKIMKSDEDVRMISAEAPVLFSKACEIFILELTHRAWVQSEANKRRTLQRSDVSAAITAADVFDFLVDIVPREGPERGGMMEHAPMEAEAQQHHAELYRAAVVSRYPYEANPTIRRHGMAIEQNIVPTLFPPQYQQCPTTTTTMLSYTHANTVQDSASAGDYGRPGDGNSRGE